MSMIHLRLLLSFAVIDSSLSLSDNTSLIYIWLMWITADVFRDMLQILQFNGKQYWSIRDDSVIYSTNIYRVRTFWNMTLIQRDWIVSKLKWSNIIVSYYRHGYYAVIIIMMIGWLRFNSILDGRWTCYWVNLFAITWIAIRSVNRK